MMEKVYAVTLKEVPIGTIAPPNESNATIGDYLGGALRIILIVAGLWAFVKLIQGGFTIMSSSGDSQKVAEGRSTIIFALIGLVVVLLSWGLIVMVEQVFNIGLGFSKPIEF